MYVSIKKVKKSGIVSNNVVNQNRNYYTAYQYQKKDVDKIVNNFSNNGLSMETVQLIHPNFLYVDKEEKLWSFNLTHSEKLVRGQEVRQVTETIYRTEPVQHTKKEAKLLLKESNEKKNVMATEGKLEDKVGEEVASKLYTDLNFASDQKMSFEEMREAIEEIHRYN